MKSQSDHAEVDQLAARILKAIRQCGGLRESDLAVMFGRQILVNPGVMESLEAQGLVRREHTARGEKKWVCVRKPNKEE